MLKYVCAEASNGGNIAELVIWQKEAYRWK